MYIYKNKVTGVTVRTFGEVNGGDWEFVREENTEAEADTKTKTKAKAKAATDGKEKEPDGE